MKELENIYLENDKIIAPYLLACSFQGFIKFHGSENNNGILQWRFSPYNQAQKLILQLRTKSEPHISASDLFSAIQTWWQEVAEMKKARNGEIYGIRK